MIIFDIIPQSPTASHFRNRWGYLLAPKISKIILIV